jgi:hypothetical protein
MDHGYRRNSKAAKELPMLKETLDKLLGSGQLNSSHCDNTARNLYRVTGYRAFIPDVDEGDCARPNLEAGRCSALDLSLTPIVAFVNGKER